MRRALCTTTLLCASLAGGAPSLSGRPQFTVDPPGPVLVAQRGELGVRVHQTGPGVLRLAVLDVRVGAPADAVLAELRVEFWKDGAPLERVAERMYFDPEEVVAGDYQLGALIRPIDSRSFVVALALFEAGADVADAVRVTLEAPGAELHADASLPGLVTGDAPAFALVLGGDGEPGADGSEIHRTVTLSGPGQAGVTLGIGVTVAAAREAATETAGRPLPRVNTSPLVLDGTWGFLGSAVAQLVANEVASGGFVAHRGARNLHWTWESVWLAWAMAELEPARALPALMAHRRGQLVDPAHPDHGIRFARVDAMGASPPLNEPGATEHFSRLAPFGLALRAVQDVPGVAAKEDLEALLDSGVASLDWWTRRRDRDGDLRYELNGAIEHPLPDSPRFTAFWTAQEAWLPLEEPTARPALDAVDLNAWLAHEALELSRLAGDLGDPRADALRSRALSLSNRLQDASEGHWSDPRAGWFDFVRRGEEKSRDFGGTLRTAAVWAPLSAGLVRDGSRAGDVIRGHLLDSAIFTAKGIAIHPGGPVSPTDSFLTLMALSRYGFEAQAEVLRGRLTALLDGAPNLHALYSPAGEPIGPGGDGAAAAVAILADRRADQREVFALQDGGLARARTGAFRRIFRVSDGRLALEIRPASPGQPETSLSAATELFSTEPMTVKVTRQALLHFPLFARAEVVIRRDGEEERRTVTGTDEDGLTLELGAGEELELRVLRFAGERSACGCAAPGAVPAFGLLALAAVAWLGRRRR